jgi:hypothetical protein
MPPMHAHTLAGELEVMDSLAGGSYKSVIAVESGWKDEWPISWREAYDTAVARHGFGAPEVIACLESIAATMRLLEHRGGLPT